MRIIEKQTKEEIINTLSSREIADDVRAAVSKIISEVKQKGDRALCDFSRKFDGVDTGEKVRATSREELENYVNETVLPQLNSRQKLAIKTAVENISFCAERQKPQSWQVQAPQGHVVGETFTPFNRVACYVPQGSFPLVSTAIHTAALAQVAGVKEIVMITSPSNDDLNVAVAYAAYVSGVTEIVYAGGAQGIAALTYGTESIRKADFICGPGNQYVAEAKRQVYGDVGIDMVAGPSEVYVLADESAEPYAVACDLVAQAEHGSGYEMSVLLSDSIGLIAQVKAELEKIKNEIKNNSGFDSVYEKNIYLINVENIIEAIEITNQCAPEHVEVMTNQASDDAKLIINAGAVFVGSLSAEPLGDFIAGPSHVLPTNSSARFASGLSAASFFRRTSILEFTLDSYKELAPLAYEFAQMEGLTGHGMSSVARLSGEERTNLYSKDPNE